MRSTLQLSYIPDGNNYCNVSLIVFAWLNLSVISSGCEPTEDHTLWRSEYDGELNSKKSKGVAGI